MLEQELIDESEFNELRSELSGTATITTHM
jgi:hypothetical protein